MKTRKSPAPPRAQAALLSVLVIAGSACRGPRTAGPPPAAPTPTPTAATASADAAVDEVLRTGRHPWARWPDLSDVVALLRELYAAEPDHLVWFDGARPLPALAGALSAASRASDRALDPADYDAARLEAERERVEDPGLVPEAERARFDLAVSVAVLREIGAVHRGRVDPRTLGWAYDTGPKKLDRAALLLEARDGAGVPALLDRLEPAYAHYSWLRDQLARYRALAASGGPPIVPDLPPGVRKVEPGRAWAGLASLRARLVALGDLPPDAPLEASPSGTPLYAGPLVRAVKRFQARHVLDADGVIGAATLAALNVPLVRRVRQLELAMERGRWLPHVERQPTVFVNIPLFTLWATDPAGDREPLTMKVVVGRSLENETPVFVQAMREVTFRPWWNVPQTIVASEIVPHARRDREWLDRQGFEIVSSWSEDAAPLPATRATLDDAEAGELFVRQEPGPRNALGLVKFVLPNDENVYLHGTPARGVFQRARRDLSHGCIRLEDPEALAEWVLRGVPGWTRERIEEAMEGDEPTTVRLGEPLVVVLFYDTVQVSADGVVSFASDIYGRDRALEEALAHGYPYPEAAAPRPARASAATARRVSSSSAGRS